MRRTAIIHLTQNRHAVVDIGDYEKLSKYKWYYNPLSGTAFRVVLLKEWRENHIVPFGTPISMHRQIMNSPEGRDIDHKNHFRLDNRRKNLRICTRSQNLGNQKPNKGREYKGVYKGTRQTKKKGLVTYWFASIMCKKQYHFLGCFTNKQDAAKAYNKAAIKYFGEFAYLNEVA